MKKTIALLLALVMSLSLAACGGGSGSGSAAPSPSPASEPESSDTLTNVGDIESGAQGEAALDFGDYTPENPLTIKLATPQSNEKSHLNVLANAFKERVETWTDGAVIVDLYMGSMGSDREIMDQVIAGTLEMGVNNTAIMANYNRLFDVLDLAYLIKDYDDVYDVMASDVWADMLGEFSSTGASLLALQCIGLRTICTTENAGPVHNMSELAGKTIRITEGPVFLDDYNAWGAAPVSMSASEIMPALQNGTIDGVDHVPVTLYTGNGQGEYIKYVAVTNQAAHFNGLDINNKFYEGLPADLQALIQKAASEAAEFRTQALEADNETYVQKLTDEYGITFYYPTEAEIAQLQEAVQPVYENFVSTHEFGSYAAAIAEICAAN